MKKLISIIISTGICFTVGISASHFQADAINTWYLTLNKPELTPPNIVFPIAWSILYLCMGISAGLVISSDTAKKKILITLFGLQLLANFLWSILFFYFQNPLLGFIDILLLDIFVTLYIIRSFPYQKASSILFIPYALWGYFATYLNGYILLNN